MVQDMALRLRPDVASEPNQREANLQNAPATQDGLILVPRVIE
jgi:aspartyl-tRNA(Asn)/glutamyl-tRNA(Gln) amidotransferase subunit C